MNRSVVLRFAASLAVSLVVVISVHAQESTDEAKVWSASDMKWQTDKTLPAVQSVPLWGNPATGEHGMLRKFPAGYAPTHAQAPVGRTGRCHLRDNLRSVWRFQEESSWTRFVFRNPCEYRSCCAVWSKVGVRLPAYLVGSIRNHAQLSFPIGSTGDMGNRIDRGHG